MSAPKEPVATAKPVAVAVAVARLPASIWALGFVSLLAIAGLVWQRQDLA